MCLFCVAATEAAERQTEAVPEEDQPAAGEGATAGQTAAEEWQERVSVKKQRVHDHRGTEPWAKRLHL